MIIGFAGFSPGAVEEASAGPVAVFSAHFESGVPIEFTGITTTEGVQDYAGLGTGPNVFGGNFLRNSSLPDAKTTLTLTGLPAHDSISLGFLLAIIDSWDAGGCPHAGPDFFNVAVEGVSIFSEVFTNHLICGPQGYIPPSGVELARNLNLGFTVGDPVYYDSAYDMGLDPTFQNIPHTSSTLTVEWFASGTFQGTTDESWAMDNVVVLVDNEPPTAVAGGPYLVAVDNDVAFDGSGSSDPDGDSLTETWTGRLGAGDAYSKAKTTGN